MKLRAKRGTRSMIDANVASWHKAQARKAERKAPVAVAPFNPIRWR